MQISDEDLRRHYASLSDEELLAMEPGDLTDAARRWYSVEVDKRGLNAAGQPGRATRGAAPMSTATRDFGEPEPDWVDSAACACSWVASPGTNHAPDAEHAREVLQAAGIPCHLSVRRPDSDQHESYEVLVPGALTLVATSVLDKEIFNPELEADWRAHFEGLSDEELEALDPDAICAGLLDRVDRLTRVYEEEVARRNGEAG